MSMQIDTLPAAPVVLEVNAQPLVLHKIPALRQTALDGAENHYLGRLLLWMLGAGLVGLAAGASLYFLAVSAYVIRVLGPLC